MGMKVETIVAIVFACATLHNIALLVDGLVPMNCVGIQIQNDVTVVLIKENTNNNVFYGTTFFG